MAESNNSKTGNGQNMGEEEVDEEGTREIENGGFGEQDELDVYGSSFWKGLTCAWKKKSVKRFKDARSKPEAIMPVTKYATFYNMNHRKRGIAVILNHEHFMVNMKLKARAGTGVDAKNLVNSLRKLGFETQVHHDLSVARVDNVVDEVSQMDHSDSDCFVLACLSHGEQGILYANDAPYKPDSLWSKFTADKCPSLAGKPKLFFIQACQGDQLDAGVTMRTQVDGSPSYKIPSHADFLIAYSTIPGFYSWRNTMRGSWFMQALCEELDEHGLSLDILTLLTFVNRKVAVDYESNVPDNSVMHQQKQIPCITYMLTRVLRFSPKNAANEVESENL